MKSATVEKPVLFFLTGLQETGGLNGTDIANFANVSKATVSQASYINREAGYPRSQEIAEAFFSSVQMASLYQMPGTTL